MKRKKINFRLMLGAGALLLSVLLFMACGETPAEDSKPLSAPVSLAVNDDSFRLEWDAVQNAGGYVVSVDGAEMPRQTDTYYSLKDLVSVSGTKALKVKAVPADGDKAYTASAWAAYTEPANLGGGDFEPVKHIFEYEAISAAAASIGRAAAGSVKITGLTYYAEENIVNLVIPDTIGGASVTVIGAQAFQSNSRIKTVIIAASVTTVEEDAFSSCGELTTVTFSGIVNTIAVNAFQNSNSITTVDVPAGKVSEYQNKLNDLAGKIKDATVTETVAVESVTLDKTTMELGVDGIDFLTATVSPAKASNQLVTWTSSNPGVAKVEANADGKTAKVTAIAQGKATITVVTVDGNKTAGCEVTVTKAPEITDPEGAAAAVSEGIAMLNLGEYDAAIAKFNAAYRADKTNQKAILYSTLAKLASIAVDKKVNDFASNYLGMKDYPGTINTLITPEWLTTYTSEYIDWFEEEVNGTWRYYDWYDPDDNSWFFEDYDLDPIAGYYYRTYKLVSETPKYEGNFYTNIWDDTTGQSIQTWYYKWDTWFFDEYCGGVVKEGYYKQQWSSGSGYTYTFVSDVKQYPWEWQYQDTDGDWIQWYDARDLEFFNVYFNGVVKEGYYEQQWSSDYSETYYELVSEAKRYIKDDLTTSYYDENGNYIRWASADENNSYNSWIFSDYGITPKDGYYAWTYALKPNEPPRYRTRKEKAPNMEVPAWIKDSETYTSSLTHDGLKSMNTYTMLMVMNLLDKNTDGLNNLLDELLAVVVGDNFEAAYTQAKTLTESIPVEPKTLESFGIDQVFEGEGQLYIGPAELNALFAALRVFKASLEYVASYDWNTDLSFLRHGDLWDSITRGDGAKLADYKPKNLPLRNNFVKARNNNMMEKSKADYNLAIDDAIAAYDAWIGDGTKLPAAYKDLLSDYKWIRDGFAKLKTAINGGTTFHIVDPEFVPEGAATYPAASANDLFTINLGKLFTPGQVAIDKWLENENVSGKGVAPVFYGRTGSYENVTWTKITDVTKMKDYELIGLYFKVAPFIEVIPQLDMRDTCIEMLPPDMAEILWNWYH